MSGTSARAAARRRTARSGSARLGNVSAALVVTDGLEAGRCARAEQILSRVVVETRTYRGGSASSGSDGRASIDAAVTAAIDEAGIDRLLIAWPAAGEPSLEVVLALCAWPAVDALAWDEGQGASLALLRIEALREGSWSIGLSDADAPDEWLARLGAERVDRVALGLESDAREAC